MTVQAPKRYQDMITFAETDPAQDDGVHALYLTREEGLAILRALDDITGRHSAASIRATERLGRLLGVEVEYVA